MKKGKEKKMELSLLSVMEREEAGEPVGADSGVGISVPGSKGLLMEPHTFDV